MHPSLIRRRILAPLAALVLLVVGGRWAMTTWYRCTADGVARTACCCPADDDAKDQREDRGATIQAADCCDVELAREPASVEVRVGSEGLSAHEVMALPALLQEGTLVAAALPSRSRPPPEPAQRGSDPPLRLLKQSFLI